MTQLLLFTNQREEDRQGRIVINGEHYKYY